MIFHSKRLWNKYSTGQMRGWTLVSPIGFKLAQFCCNFRNFTCALEIIFVINLFISHCISTIENLCTSGMSKPMFYSTIKIIVIYSSSLGQFDEMGISALYFLNKYECKRLLFAMHTLEFIISMEHRFPNMIQLGTDFI